MIRTVRDVITYYNQCDFGYVFKRENLSSRYAQLPSDQSKTIFLQLIERLTREEFISLVGLAYDQRFGQLENQLIEKSDCGLRPLTVNEFEKIVSSHFQGKLGDKAKSTLLNRLGIVVEFPKSPEELEKEESERLKQAEELIKSYSLVRALSSLHGKFRKNSLGQEFKDLYDFLNFSDHPKIQARNIAFPEAGYSPKNSFSEIRQRLDLLKKLIKTNSENGDFKDYGIILGLADTNFKKEEHKIAYDRALLFEPLKTQVTPASTLDDAKRLFYTWSEFASTADEARDLLSALFLKKANLVLEFDDKQQQDYFHCLCGRRIPQVSSQSCPVCQSRQQTFGSVNLTDKLLDVYLSLGMFQTARALTGASERVSREETHVLADVNLAFDEKCYQRCLASLHRLKQQYAYFENIVAQKEKVAEQQVQIAKELEKEALKQSQHPQEFGRQLVLIYRHCRDYDALEKLSQTYLGVDFQTYFKDHEIVSIDMDLVSVTLHNRFGTGFELRLKLDPSIAQDVEEINNLQVILVEGWVTTPSDGLVLPPLFQNKNLSLFRKKIKLLASEVKREKYTLFLGNGTSYSLGKRFVVSGL